MADILRMPRMSDTMEEGNIVGWLVEEGATIESGDTIAEVETDKATMELDSPYDGVLLHIAIKEGPVPINGVLAVIGEKGEDWQAVIAESGKTEEASAPAVEETAAVAASVENVASAAPAVAENIVVSQSAPASSERVKASPLAKSIAQHANLDLSTINGTGDHGRIIKRDVEAAMSQPQPQAVAPSPSPQAAPAPSVEAPASPQTTPFYHGGGDANFENVPVSQMRKVIARRLGESKFTAPHFYLTVEMDMGKAMKWRKQINAVAPTKISYNDLVIKACASALRLHPAVNSSWMGDHIRVNHDVNIGVAVAVPDGLLVPVVRFADMKTLSQVNTEVKALAGKAKERKLQPAEMQGNTFTISNLGMFGIEEFTAIINPPDACILAVGGIIEKPVVENGEIVAGNRMKVTLSCDHRVVDGATAAQFLNTLKSIMEDPIRLMV